LGHIFNQALALKTGLNSARFGHFQNGIIYHKNDILSMVPLGCLKTKKPLK